MKENGAKTHLQLMKYKALYSASENQEDLNALTMIEKLFIVTTDAQEIWDAFEAL